MKTQFFLLALFALIFASQAAPTITVISTTTPDQPIYITVPTTGDGGSPTTTPETTCAFGENYVVSAVALTTGCAFLLL
jgi:hypothetical protein